MIKGNLGANLIFFGSGLAFLIALGQILKHNKKPIHYVSSAMFFCVGFWQIHIGFSLYEKIFAFLPYLTVLHFLGASSFGPLLYAYSRTLGEKKFNVMPSVYLSIFFGILSISILILCCIFSPAGLTFNWKEIIISVFTDYKNPPLSKSLRFFSFIPQISVIFTIVLIMWKVFSIKRNDTAWFRLRIWMSFLLTLTFLSALIGVFIEFRVIGGLVAMLSISVFFLIGQRLPVFFEVNSLGLRQETRIGSLDKEEIAKKILATFEIDHIYRVEDLSLAMLSDAISDEKFKMSPEQLSEFINLEFQKNFNSFVNDYRVKEAMRLLENDQHSNALHIGMEVGFNSKSTFYSAFKNITGKTPLEYRKGKLQSKKRK